MTGNYPEGTAAEHVRLSVDCGHGRRLCQRSSPLRYREHEWTYSPTTFLAFYHSFSLSLSLPGRSTAQTPAVLQTLESPPLPDQVRLAKAPLLRHEQMLKRRPPLPWLCVFWRSSPSALRFGWGTDALRAQHIGGKAPPPDAPVRHLSAAVESQQSAVV